MWFGTIEYTRTDYEQIWNRLLANGALQLVCLGYEEGVELDDVEEVSIEAFPWHDSRLVIGAVRKNTGDWEIRRGTSYFLPK